MVVVVVGVMEVEIGLVVSISGMGEYAEVRRLEVEVDPKYSGGEFKLAATKIGFKELIFEELNVMACLYLSTSLPGASF